MYYEFYGGPQDGQILKLSSALQTIFFPAYMNSMPQYIAASYSPLAHCRVYRYVYEVKKRWNSHKDGIEMAYCYKGLESHD